MYIGCGEYYGLKFKELILVIKIGNNYKSKQHTLLQVDADDFDKKKKKNRIVYYTFLFTILVRLFSIFYMSGPFEADSTLWVYFIVEVLIAHNLSQTHHSNCGG